MAKHTVEDLLESARARLDRVDPHGAQAAMQDGAMLIDIRAEGQRQRDGVVPGATFIARNVLEWRVDQMGDARVIVMCDEGYQSSLAAATLCDLGADATDLVGGFQAWRAAGLPVKR